MGGQRVAPCRYLLSHTYTSKPDRKRIKIQIKKNEKTEEPMLQRAYIFLTRPTHLSPTPRKETRESAVYEMARTCTQES